MKSRRPLKFTMYTEVFKLYPNKRLPLSGKKTLDRNLAQFRCQILPSKQDFVPKKPLNMLNRIELEVKRWKTTLFLENNYF